MMYGVNQWSMSGRGRPNPDDNALSKPSILIVEDEAMIRMAVVDMLDDLGYSLAAEAGDIDTALELAATSKFDAAILDINLDGIAVAPVVETIRDRGLPVILMTGYGPQGLPEDFADIPTLQKPFKIDALADLLRKALDGPAL